MSVEELKNKSQLTRSDIAELLASIGAPGEKQEEKKQAIAELGKQNSQGFKLEDSLGSYIEY